MTLASVLPGNRTAQHRSLVLDQQRAEREHFERLEVRRRELDEARVHADRLQHRADEACAAVARLNSEIRTLNLEFDRHKEEREREILAHADVRIDAFIDDLKATHDRLKVTRSSVVTIDSTSGRKRFGETSNLEAIRIVSDAICAARERAEALKCEIVDDLDSALEELRRSIPTIEKAEASLKDLPEAS